jgi:hypothetical protein
MPERTNPKQRRLLWVATTVAAIGGAVAVAGQPVVAALLVVPVAAVCFLAADRGWQRDRDAAVAELRARGSQLAPSERQREFDALVAQFRGENTRQIRDLARDLGVEHRSSFAMRLWKDFNSPMRTPKS